MVQSQDVGTPQDVTAGAAPKETKNVDDSGVAPESLQKTPGKQIPTVSRKGQRAIGACLLSLAVGIAVGIFIGYRMKHGGYDTPFFTDGFGNVCEFTLYPETCNSTLVGADTTNPKSYVSKSMTVSMSATNETLLNLTRCRDSWPTKTGIQYSTWQMCIDMYEDIADVVSISLDTIKWFSPVDEATILNDLEQRATAALTYHLTCVHGLQDQGLWNLTGDKAAMCSLDTERMTALLSNAISLLEHFTFSNETVQLASPPSRRRLLSDPEAGSLRSDVKSRTPDVVYEMEDDEQERFPAWLSKRDRRLLQSSNNIKVNTVVALDGSAYHTSIQAAVDYAPSNLTTVRYVIHIKKGIYYEQVRVPGNKTMLTFIGDGPGQTIITGNMSSRMDNVTTKFTATVAVSGDYFIAKNLTIRNTAGPDGHQAVALRVTSFQSAFTWLSIEGYQDAHYVHTSQQFYSYCTIYGTIDFIFGSAAVVFQNCSLLARLPNPGQVITYTASGIASPLVQKYAGQVFHSCTVDAAPDLMQNGSVFQLVFLGRPWHQYARTIFIKSKLGALIDPRGWTLWNKNVTSKSHVIYGEYKNFGPGSDFSLRVPWSKQLTPQEAQNYSVDKFIRGYQWLPSYNISYSGTI
ncbi:hypothetical protein KC19_11G008100 [Ceratodon purpureus]|uniref:Pectinesterase n=1 Tax=Ceratodon purpureus TaxID=3225 RepID=A0A8T0GBI1_CERPU|nr:hypothetical protein KC19_11G008100 [Ceratodon purpureus]